MRRAFRSPAVLALGLLPSCYAYVPVETTTPPVGETVAFEITDLGRVGLAERIGAGVRRIEGRILGTQGDEYLVSVFRVASIDGESSAWSGETIRLDRTYVSQVRERQLSKSRTWLAATAATLAVVVLVTQTGLSGFFDGAEEDEPDSPTTEMHPRRVP